VHLVTCAAVVLIMLGTALVVLPLAEPSPDPVRIERVSFDARGTRVDVRVLRRGRLSVEVRTVSGELVRVLVPERAVPPGVVRVVWDGPAGSTALPSGTYLIRATAHPGLRPFVAERQLVAGA
jgi:hypothetical protein